MLENYEKVFIAKKIDKNLEVDDKQISVSH